MRLAVNGVWGNLGVASAALITGYLIDNGGWRMAFIIPGVVLGRGRHRLCARAAGRRSSPKRGREIRDGRAADAQPASYKALLLRVSLIVFLTTAVSSIIFQATTFALPKIFDERLQGLATEACRDGCSATGSAAMPTSPPWSACSPSSVFAVASMAQLVVGSLLDRFGRAPGVHGRGGGAARVLRPDGRARAKAGRWRSRSASCSARSARSRSTIS